jgi:hypothetical protein
MLTREFIEHARRMAMRARAERWRTNASARVWHRADADTFGEFTTAAPPGDRAATGRRLGNGAPAPAPARRKLWWEDER